MNQSLSPISDPRHESTEVSRRLYRSMMETTRQLDDLRSHAKATRDLFSVQAHLLRMKLREYAERLLFSSTLIPSQKIEEILWRKGFYEDVSTAKRLRKDNQWLPEERAQLVIHLKCGVGFYHHLLLCLQAVFGITSGCIDFCLVFPDQDYAKSKVPLPSKQLETARDSVHRCLVCLGDLSRYLMDIPPCWDEQMAYRYYHQALSWNPDIGKPHNQLGTLSSSTNCNLDAVYHFMRCLVSSQPFEGAEGNLKRSFERNSQNVPQEKAISLGSNFWRCCCSEPGTGQLSESQDHVQQFLAHFLLLADVWFFDKKPVSNISDLCHQTLLDFRRCLGLMETEDSENNPDVSVRLSRPRENFPSRLTKDMVLKIVVVTLMCLFKLKTRGSDQSSSVIAFLLAILSLLVQEVLEHFKNSVLNISVQTIRERSSQESVEKANGNHNGTEEESLPNGTEHLKENGHKEDDHSESNINGVSKEGLDEMKSKKRKRIVRRRNRQCHSSDDSDESNGEGSIALSDVSEDEEVVLDLSSDDDEVPHNGGLQDKGNADADVVILEEISESADASKSKCLVNGHNDKNFLCRRTMLEVVNPVDVLEQVAGEGLLPAIKICADWLQGDKSVVEAVGRDSLEMLKSFVDLVNVINIDTVELEKDPAAKLFLKNRSILESKGKVPLCEDAQLQKLLGLARAHTDLDWEMILQNHLTSKEEALIRIHKLVLFCHFLETVPETGVKYDKETRVFSICANKGNPDKAAISKSSQAVGSSVDLQRREEVMHNMGQLWLRAEVQNLETSVKRGSKGATFSPYLVLDVDALTKYYNLVGQLMASKKFIMIVPSVVLSALDQLKRESVLARDAIRWLEYQFQKGSRFLRAQTMSEVLHLPLVSYPKQKSREAWAYFKVLECCHYLNNHNTSFRNKDSDAGLVTLLTGHTYADSNEFSPVGVAKAVGIAVEHIESFFAKWKTSSKSHG